MCRLVPAADREHTELKMINFGFSYKLPAEAEPVSHCAPWDGTPTCHEDGYLTGELGTAWTPACADRHGGAGSPCA